MMSQLIHWTNEELDTLRKQFLCKTSIKDISRLLNRTPGAVNKALTRYNIRQANSNTSIKQKDHSSELSISSHHTIHKSLKVEKTTFSLKRFIKSHLDNWVPFSKVITFLEIRGYEIKKGTKEQDIPWFVNNKPSSDFKMLFIANRIRRKENKPIFLVEELTC